MRCNHQIKTDFFPSFQTNHHYCHPHHCNNTAKLHCDSKCIVMRGNSQRWSSHLPTTWLSSFYGGGDGDDDDDGGGHGDDDDYADGVEEVDDD